MRRRHPKLEAGLTALLITGAVILYLVIAIGIYQAAQAQGVIIAPPTPPQTLPQKCAKFSKEPDPATWNPDTDSYPPNHEWMDCMGVGLK